MEDLAAVRRYLRDYWDRRNQCAMLDLDKNEITECPAPAAVIAELGAMFIRAVSDGTTNIYG